MLLQNHIHLVPSLRMDATCYCHVPIHFHCNMLNDKDDFTSVITFSHTVVCHNYLYVPTFLTSSV